MVENTTSISRLLLDPVKVALFLAGIAVLLIIASLLGQLLTFVVFPEFVSDHQQVQGLIRLFNLNEENNAPTLYSFCLLLFSFILIIMITLLERRQQAPGTTKWAILAFCIFFMMADEAFSFHEKLIDPMRKLLNRDFYGIFFYTWVIPGIAAVILFVLFFYRFFRRFDKNVRRTVLIAGILYFGGAIGMELVGGLYEDIYGDTNLPYNLIATVEESLEMAGVIFFVKGLLEYVYTKYRTVQFELIHV